MTAPALQVLDGGKGQPAMVSRDDAEAANDRMIAALRAAGLRPQFNEHGCVVVFEINDYELDERVRQDFLDRVEVSLTPCSPGVLREEIAKLQAGTLSPAGADLDVTMRLQLLTDVLASYPADIVRQACREQRRSSKFLPTEAELVDRCEAYVRVRRCARDILQQDAGYGIWAPRMRGWLRSKFWSGHWGPEPGEPRCWVPAPLLRKYEIKQRSERPPPSDEERAAIDELVRAWRMSRTGEG